MLPLGGIWVPQKGMHSEAVSSVASQNKLLSFSVFTFLMKLWKKSFKVLATFYSSRKLSSFLRRVILEFVK